MVDASAAAGDDPQVESDAHAPSPPRARTGITPGGALAALFGAALFAYTLRQTSLAPILAGMRSVGWGFLAILGLSGVRVLARAWAWSLCTEGPTPLRIRDAAPALVTGDALGNLTPLGLFVSEPTKAVFVRHRVPLMTAVSGLAIENLLYSFTVALVIGGGAAALLLSFDVSQALEILGLGALAGMLLLLAAAAWILSRQIPIVTGLVDWLRRRRLAPAALTERLEKLRTLEEAVYGFRRRHPERLWPVLALEGLYHAAGVAEIYVTIALLIGPPTWLVAFIFETVNRLINVAFKFVPMRLGVDEAGSGVLASVLGYGSTIGVSLALVRKVRVLFWTALGVAILARRGLTSRVDEASAVTPHL
jgi:Lysylphosphatidylglycerol synthase TM region